MKNNKILKNLINLNNLIYCVFQHRMFAENEKKIDCLFKHEKTVHKNKHFIKAIYLQVNL